MPVTTNATANAPFQTNPVRLKEVADPAATADTGKLYTNDITGRTELMYKDDTGAEIQITSGGTLNSAGSGAYIQGGNSFGADGVLGTNDTFDLLLRARGTNLARLNATDFAPLSDNAGNIGTGSKRWASVRAVQVTTGDLNMESDDGLAKWTLIEEPERITAVNRNTGKRYELMLKEIA